MAIQPERVAAELKGTGLDLMGVYKLSGELQARAADDPELAEAFQRSFEAQKRALFEEAARGAGLDPGQLDMTRDWERGFQTQRKAAEIAEKARASLAQRQPSRRSLDELRDATEALLAEPSQANRARYLEEAPLVQVDHREEEHDLLAAFADYFAEGKLRIEGEDPIVIRFGRRRVSLALTHTPADRHRALLALNQALGPRYEVRWAVDSNRSDTLAFALLPGERLEALREAPRGAHRRAVREAARGPRPLEPRPGRAMIPSLTAAELLARPFLMCPPLAGDGGLAYSPLQPYAPVAQSDRAAAF